MKGHGSEIILFQSMNHVLLAEKLLKGAGVSCRVIPIPRNLSSDCGVCIRFEAALRPQVEKTLRDRVEVEKIVPLDGL
jgi:hypothetical protein